MKLKNENIIFLGATKFDDAFESTSFTTAKYLAGENNVYYVDYPYTWRDYFREKGSAKFNVRRKHFDPDELTLIDTTIERLKVIIPPLVLSINFLPEGRFYRSLLKMNEKRIASKVNAVLKSRNVKSFIFINSFNFHYPDLPKFIRPALNVYQCVDPLIIPYDRKHGVVSEAEILKTADLVICTSKQLFLEKSKSNPNSYFIPNAADVHHSNKALKASLPVHSLLSGIPGPIIGYFGSIERRIDYGLLEKVASLNTGKSFVFAGGVADEYLPPGFRDLPNVYFIGKVPFSEMPSVIKGFSICIIPFKRDKVSATIFPLKLFEYLGTGKPVVSTDFNPDLKEYTLDTVVYCKTPEEFSKALTDVVELDTPEKQQKRLQVAANNTWDMRISELSKLINSFTNDPLQ
jgi:teichuronic acid biosynthesis glycosyltransferase TuaH